MFAVPFQGADQIIRQCMLSRARSLAWKLRSTHVDLCFCCVSYERLWFRI